MYYYKWKFLYYYGYTDETGCVWGTEKDKAVLFPKNRQTRIHNIIAVVCTDMNIDDLILKSLSLPEETPPPPESSEPEPEPEPPFTIVPPNTVILRPDGTKFVTKRTAYILHPDEVVVPGNPHEDGDYSYICNNRFCKCHKLHENNEPTT